MPTKGQTLSKSAILQMKQSKATRMLAKYNWANLDLYLDVEIGISARNRTLEHITPRKFKDAILAGETLTTLIDKGISKHLLKFLGNMAQGKITITKEQFLEEYEGGKTLDEISAIHKIPREDLTYLRELFGVKCKGAKFQARKSTEVPLTDRQKQILYGSLMGDAKRMSPSSAGFGHGTDQRDYLFWKFFEFENLTGPNKLQHTVSTGTTGNELHDWRFYTSANTDFEKAMTLFYASRTKQITEEILEQLTPLSLAVWYQDDGNTSFKYRMADNSFVPHCEICTESFSDASCELIKKWFKTKYQWDTLLVPRGSGFRIHSAGNEESKHFIEIIKPHIIPMFHYKVDYDAYIKWKEGHEPLLPFKGTDVEGMIEEARERISKWTTV